MDPTSLPQDLFRNDPTIHPSTYIARGAQVIGDVRLAASASIWYNAVLRGDINYIDIGPRTNIQDGSILHVTNTTPCVVGADVTVGHNANLHACTIEAGCLIGIGAIVLSGAHIKKGCVIGAGTVIKEDAVVEAYSLVVGVPGKVKRMLTPDTYQTNLQWADKYVHLAIAHQARYGDT